MKKRLLPALIFAFAGCLGGCSDGVNAPSLMSRPIEKQANTTPPVAAPVNTAPITPALQRQINDLLAKVRDGDSAFTRVDEARSRLIVAGRGAAEGSEAWVVGQQAQSELEAARQDSAAALGELETLLLAQTQAAASDATVGGVAELTEAQAEASAIVTRQGARLAELTR
ncbi:MAG: hypothetical protein JWO15_1626 [Sphingomonadales bacterium]|nr:hypothetical protein [Sphingomonadales bacterium]